MSTHYQAFHAWLPSFRPSGTKVSLRTLAPIGSRRTATEILSFSAELHFF
jgi:hypothetical protein